DQARAAVVRDDLAGAIEHLIDAWRATPAPPIAEAIDTLTACANADVRVPSGKTATARNAAWNKAARSGDAAYAGVLVTTLCDTKGNVDTLARIELLVKRGHDPRVSAKLADLIETPIYNASAGRTNKFWKRLFELLPKLGDPRLATRARK